MVCILTRLSELILEVSSLLKYLYAVVVRVCDDNVLIHAKAETMWRVKLPFPRTELAELASKNDIQMPLA